MDCVGGAYSTSFFVITAFVFLLPQVQSRSTAAMSIGVPIKVLHEAEGHIVTCETNTGEVYRGKLIEAEDNMNCQVSFASQGWREGQLIWAWEG